MTVYCVLDVEKLLKLSSMLYVWDGRNMLSKIIILVLNCEQMRANSNYFSVSCVIAFMFLLICPSFLLSIDQWSVSAKSRWNQLKPHFLLMGSRDAADYVLSFAPTLVCFDFHLKLFI